MSSCSTASNSRRWGEYERSVWVEGDGLESASIVGLLQDGRHGELRGVGEQARRLPWRRSHTRSSGADVSAALSASKFCCSAGPHVNWA